MKAKKYIISQYWPLFWTGFDAITLFHFIFINRTAWDDISGIHQQAMILHEQVHVKQQGGHPFKFAMNYLFNKNFRLNKEVEAYAVQIYYLYQNENSSLHVLIDNFSHILSSGLYGKIHHVEAYELLYQKINQLSEGSTC